ncbi:MAG TPA: cytochrome c oxidase subunit 3 [Bryobacteraceae bacterium]
MSPVRTLDVSSLPAFEISNRAPLWWGQLLMAVIEGALLCILIAMYFYLRLSVDVWPPPGIKPLGLTLPTLALIPLVLSAGGSYAASEGAKRDDKRLMLLGLGANLTLAIIFLILRFMEWRTFNFTWASDIHGTLVWTILFLHTFDVIADLLMTAVLIGIVAGNKHGPKQRMGVHVDSVLWYFLVLIWLPFYVVVYWGPRLVGSR